MTTKLQHAWHWFAGLTWDKLQANSYKSGWDHLGTGGALSGFLREVKELREAIERFDPNYDKIVDEATDVANFALFIAYAAAERKRHKL